MSDDVAMKQLVGEVEALVAGSEDRPATLAAICKLLHDSVEHYHWVGFYLVDEPTALEGQGELVLGPYVGEPTDHVRIPFGRGICGQAAARGETFVVQDVSKETNYLACSTSVQSEIVVPVIREGRVVGELDIDSHQLAPFGAQDREVLEAICGRVARLF